MKWQQKKKYLESYRYLVIDIRNIKDEIEEIKQSMTGSSKPLSGMPRSGSGRQRDMSDYYVRLEALEGKLRKQLKRKVEKQMIITDAIEAMPTDKLRTLMRLRYLHGCTWEEVAEQMGITARWATYLHGDALKEIKIVPKK